MPEVDGEKIYSFGPNLLSTPERLRARFNALYQAKRIAQYAVESEPTPDDFNKYVAQFPEEGDKLNRMYTAGDISGYGAAAGFLSGTVYVYRVTKNPPLLITGALLSTFAGYLVGDDIGSWIYGTYKFDAGATNEKYAKWVYDSRQAASE